MGMKEKVPGDQEDLGQRDRMRKGQTIVNPKGPKTIETRNYKQNLQPINYRDSKERAFLHLSTPFCKTTRVFRAPSPILRLSPRLSPTQHDFADGGLAFLQF